MSAAEEFLALYLSEVAKLLDLHRRVQDRLDRCALRDFNTQRELVQTMTDVGMLALMADHPAEGEKK